MDLHIGTIYNYQITSKIRQFILIKEVSENEELFAEQLFI